MAMRDVDREVLARESEYFGARVRALYEALPIDWGRHEKTALVITQMLTTVRAR